MVNGSVVLRMDAPVGTKMEDATITYTGRSITSLTVDPNCIIPGVIEIYVSPTSEDGTWTKVSELCGNEGTFTIPTKSIYKK